MKLLKSDFVSVGEVATRLTEQPGVTCALEVDHDHRAETLTLTLRIPASGINRHEVLELAYALEHLASLNAVRAFAANYDVNPLDLATFIERRGRR